MKYKLQKNSIKKYCIKCNTLLIIGKTWFEWQKRWKNYKCIKCHYKYVNKNHTKYRKSFNKWRKNYRQTTKGKYYTLKEKAKRRNIKFSIKLREFEKIYKNKICYYCRDKIKLKEWSLDRIDNKKGYTLGNIYVCCLWCNKMKLNYSIDEWLNKMNKIILNYNSSLVHKQYTMLLGRYQCLPPHLGHQSLVLQLLKEGKNVLIVLRKSDGTDKNPYTIEQRKQAFEKIFKKELKETRVKIIGFEDVIEIAYGRTPGWGIREIKLAPEIEAISGTKLRKEKNE